MCFEKKVGVCALLTQSNITDKRGISENVLSLSLWPLLRKAQVRKVEGNRIDGTESEIKLNFVKICFSLPLLMKHWKCIGGYFDLSTLADT